MKKIARHITEVSITINYDFPKGLDGIEISKMTFSNITILVASKCCTVFVFLIISMISAAEYFRLTR
jgi:hypothetical protein